MDTNSAAGSNVYRVSFKVPLTLTVSVEVLSLNQQQSLVLATDKMESILTDPRLLPDFIQSIESLDHVDVVQVEFIGIDKQSGSNMIDLASCQPTARSCNKISGSAEVVQTFKLEVYSQVQDLDKKLELFVQEPSFEDAEIAVRSMLVNNPQYLEIRISKAGAKGAALATMRTPYTGYYVELCDEHEQVMDIEKHFASEDEVINFLTNHHQHPLCVVYKYNMQDRSIKNGKREYEWQTCS